MRCSRAQVTPLAPGLKAWASSERYARLGVSPPSGWHHLRVASQNGGKTRKDVKVQVMRELMFASGGRCAMTDCGLSLVSPTGGWVGTVAHIVGAEKGGPRGAGPETAEERRSFRNLILMCATHGREVDAPETGEAKFPIDALRAMKSVHETRITDAVREAIEQDASGVPATVGAIDTSLRSSEAATSAAGLLESMMVDEPDDVAKVVEGLSEVRRILRGVSGLALETLAQLLQLWVHDCRDRNGGYDFGDPSGVGPKLNLDSVENRVLAGKQAAHRSGLNELEDRMVLEEVAGDEYEPATNYILERLWNVGGRDNFWVYAAHFLYEGHGLEIQDWVRGLDFSIFDRKAGLGRDVPWR